MLAQMRDYQKLESKDLRVIGKRVQDGIESQLMVIQTPFGYRRVAEMFRPEGANVTFASIEETLQHSQGGLRDLGFR